jgi:hypothetical protein
MAITLIGAFGSAGCVSFASALGDALQWSVVGSSGGSSSSTNFHVTSTSGQSSVIGESLSANFRLGAGFWYGREDVDGDGSATLFDNCPADSNPLQEDLDGDALGDACDPDDDNDLVADADEGPCGSDPLDVTPPLSRPERVDGAFAGVDDDGDTMADEVLPGGAGGFDCDGDGYTGAAEGHVFSYLPQADGDQKVCQEYDLAFVNPNPDVRPSRRWPSDVNRSVGPPDSFNRVNILDLTTLLAPVRYFGTDLGTNSGDVRFDLDPGPGLFTEDINITDLTSLLAGPSGMPPMLAGVRVFDGPGCPYAP